MFSTKRYTDWLSDIASVALKGGKALEKEEGVKAFADHQQKVVVHFIGSADNVASYAARVLHPRRIKDTSIHVLVEQGYLGYATV